MPATAPSSSATRRRRSAAAAAAATALAILGPASAVVVVEAFFAPAAHVRTSLVVGDNKAFVPRRACRRTTCSSAPPFSSRSSPCPSSSSLVIRRMSDVGGGLGDNKPPPGGGDGGGKGKGRKGDLDDFLDGEMNPESDNLRRAREQMSEDSLPISFGYEKPSEEEEKGEEAAEEQSDDERAEENNGKSPSKSAERGDIIRMPGMAGAAATYSAPGAEDVLALAENPYLDVVSRLSPSDVISKFTSTAHPRVQDAVRTTILGLVGNLPKLGFDAATVTTGERLASLMFQLQMTGYMFKNAEYRLSLTQSLGMTKPPTAYSQMAKDGFLLEGKDIPNNGIDMGEELAVDKDELEDEDALSRGKVKGKIRVRYGNKKKKEKGAEEDEEGDDDTPPVAKKKEATDDDEKDDPFSSAAPSEMEVEVDAEAYLTELRSEVTRLRDELTLARKTKEDALRKDLLVYIRTMSQDELRGLTGTMSPDVLGAMKGLVNVVMAGIGEGRIGPDTVTEQSGEAMAQLCMWQLVVGYNLRELEVREEMRAALKGSVSSSSSSSATSSLSKGKDDDDSGGVLDDDENAFM